MSNKEKNKMFQNKKPYRPMISLKVQNHTFILTKKIFKKDQNSLKKLLISKSLNLKIWKMMNQINYLKLSHWMNIYNKLKHWMRLKLNLRSRFKGHVVSVRDWKAIKLLIFINLIINCLIICCIIASNIVNKIKT